MADSKTWRKANAIGHVGEQLVFNLLMRERDTVAVFDVSGYGIGIHCGLDLLQIKAGQIIAHEIKEECGALAGNWKNAKNRDERYEILDVPPLDGEDEETMRGTGNAFIELIQNKDKCDTRYEETWNGWYTKIKHQRLKADGKRYGLTISSRYVWFVPAVSKLTDDEFYTLPQDEEHKYPRLNGRAIAIRITDTELLKTSEAYIQTAGSDRYRWTGNRYGLLLPMEHLFRTDEKTFEVGRDSKDRKYIEYSFSVNDIRVDTSGNKYEHSRRYTPMDDWYAATIADENGNMEIIGWRYTQPEALYIELCERNKTVWAWRLSIRENLLHNFGEWEDNYKALASYFGIKRQGKFGFSSNMLYKRLLAIYNYCSGYGIGKDGEKQVLSVHPVRGVEIMLAQNTFVELNGGNKKSIARDILKLCILGIISRHVPSGERQDIFEYTDTTEQTYTLHKQNVKHHAKPCTWYAVHPLTEELLRAANAVAEKFNICGNNFTKDTVRYLLGEEAANRAYDNGFPMTEAVREQREIIKEALMELLNENGYAYERDVLGRANTVMLGHPEGQLEQDDDTDDIFSLLSQAEMQAFADEWERARRIQYRLEKTWTGYKIELFKTANVKYSKPTYAEKGKWHLDTDKFIMRKG